MLEGKKAAEQPHLRLQNEVCKMSLKNRQCDFKPTIQLTLLLPKNIHRQRPERREHFRVLSELLTPGSLLVLSGHWHLKLVLRLFSPLPQHSEVLKSVFNTLRSTAKRGGPQGGAWDYRKSWESWESVQL